MSQYDWIKVRIIADFSIYPLDRVDKLFFHFLCQNMFFLVKKRWDWQMKKMVKVLKFLKCKSELKTYLEVTDDQVVLL